MTAAITWLKRALPLSRRAKIVARIVPAKYWFRCALYLSRAQGRTTDAARGHGRLTELLMRDHWLRELTLHGTFPIAHRIHGKQELDRYAENGPVIYCSTHLAGFEVCLRALIEMGHTPVAIADGGRITEGESYPVIGLEKRLRALRATPYVLTQIRSLLQGGSSVACMADREYLDQELSSNLLRLAGLRNVPVIFTWAKLAADNVFDVMVQPVPHPYCENEAAIQENMKFLQRIHGEIRAWLGLNDQAEDPGAALPELPPAAAPLRSEAA